jgi:hypothetical protein
MKGAQPGARFDTDLVVEQSSDPLIGVQRIGLSAAPVQGEHEQFPQPLAQRMFSTKPVRSAAVSWHRRALVAELESDSFVST